MIKPNIIAEIGFNHLGSMHLAQEMIAVAAENGATHVKTQVFDEKYLKSGPWDTDGRREIYKKAQLSIEQLKHLKTYSEKQNIKFFASVMSVRDAKLYHEVVQDIVKIPSFESRNIDLLQYCNANFDKIIMSTGTCTLNEIRKSCELIDIEKLVLLHCVSSYPCTPDGANLPRILKLRDILIEATNYSGCCIDIFGQTGFSDHIPGVESCKIALEYNIGWIEKHFTIDRELPGRDNKFAILPEELQNLSDYIHMKLAMNEIKHVLSASEQETRILQTGRFASDENNNYI